MVGGDFAAGLLLSVKVSSKNSAPGGFIDHNAQIEMVTIIGCKDLLMYIVVIRYVLQLNRIMYKEVTRSAGIITETALAGADPFFTRSGCVQKSWCSFPPQLFNTHISFLTMRFFFTINLSSLLLVGNVEYIILCISSLLLVLTTSSLQNWLRDLVQQFFV